MYVLGRIQQCARCGYIDSYDIRTIHDSDSEQNGGRPRLDFEFRWIERVSLEDAGEPAIELIKETLLREVDSVQLDSVNLMSMINKGPMEKMVFAPRRAKEIALPSLVLDLGKVSPAE